VTRILLCGAVVVRVCVRLCASVQWGRFHAFMCHTLPLATASFRCVAASRVCAGCVCSAGAGAGAAAGAAADDAGDAVEPPSPEDVTKGVALLDYIKKHRKVTAMTAMPTSSAGGGSQWLASVSGVVVCSAHIVSVFSPCVGVARVKRVSHVRLPQTCCRPCCPPVLTCCSGVLKGLAMRLLRCVALRCVALRCVALRCVALRCVALRCDVVSGLTVLRCRVAAHAPHVESAVQGGPQCEGTSVGGAATAPHTTRPGGV
jgi:hypothetical protein